MPGISTDIKSCEHEEGANTEKSSEAVGLQLSLNSDISDDR